MYAPARKHADPAIQAEFAQVYKILSQLSANGNRTILTGASTFNGQAGRVIQIPFQATTDYFVSITPLIDTVSFDEQKEIVRENTQFTVKSALSGVAFLWAVIL